ncbi:MAG TPA: LLM class flavin-dependent oxidoreductase [Candidatus Binataceae bacterium]|jgi:alkanesulfonate monooxygenase SsuD/methylene tetrahydromethanopterin reductase-like flavin-dependent oxidoreductase (luciferase family)|nr:LLM class flavin-dependent oxidoreductase [Candidatus Binataceae bacterium]
MKFALMYEIEMPKPWYEGNEYDKYWQVMAQIQYADEMGFDSVWAVEHHGLEELSHCSAPEILFAAASQRTKRIRFGHGAVLLPQPYNHPVRVAERIGALDILSNGRLDVGFARSTTLCEMGGFGVDPNDTRPMMNEALEVIPQLMTTDRFPGYQGKYFTIGPNRNVIPKPIQKPHPPLWMACSSPQSFDIAANAGLGVLSFNVIQAQTLQERVRNYRKAIENPANPVGATINNQIATFMMTLCGEDNDQSIEMAGEGMHWYMSLLRGQTPYWQNIFEKGREDLFAQIESYKYMSRRAPEALQFGADLTEEKARDQMRPRNLVDKGLLCAGNPDTCIRVLERFDKLGIDLILCFMEMGRVSHQRTMDSIRLFGKYVIPHFKANGQAASANGQC